MGEKKQVLTERQITTIPFTVRLDREFLSEYDLALLAQGFKTRNEAIRAAMREQLEKWRKRRWASLP